MSAKRRIRDRQVTAALPPQRGPIDVFSYDDYKKYVGDWIARHPHGGRGQVLRIAAALRVHSSLISQVLHKPEKQLTPEQACTLAEYMGLSAGEADCLLALVELERAGSEPLRKALRRRLLLLRERSLQLSGRLAADRVLTEEERATFYSSWQYSAVRLLCSLPGAPDAAAIADRLRIPLAHCQRVLDFLLAKELVVQDAGGLRLGPARIHLGSGSKFVGHHHRSWRVRTMAAFDSLAPTDLVFTAPMSLAKADFQTLRAQIVELLASVSERVKDSPAEMLACLNIDFVEL